MAFPLRPRTMPQCSACLRGYAWAETSPTSAPSFLSRQQVRGAKKTAARNDTATIPVRLLQDLPGYGKVGAYVPLTSGEMRNKFFPRRLADYTTLPERKALRVRNIPVERDYEFGRAAPVPAEASSMSSQAPSAIAPTAYTSTPRAAAPEKLSPERSIELLNIFVHPRLDFYRQPLPAEASSTPITEPETPASTSSADVKPEQNRSAAMDLLAARSTAPKPKQLAPQGIYGSVTPHDVLVAIRAAIATNDEAARIVLAESDIEFLDLKEQDAGRGVKHTGDYTVSIRVKGAETGGNIKRTVRVIPQEVV